MTTTEKTTENAGHTWVVVGAAEFGGAWGRGETRAEAVTAAKREGYMIARKGYTVLHFRPGSTFEGVDEMGNVRYTGPAPAAEIVSARPPRATPAAPAHEYESERGNDQLGPCAVCGAGRRAAVHR